MFYPTTASMQTTRAIIATPSSRNNGKFTAPLISLAASGCLAIEFAAADANIHIPIAAPITPTKLLLLALATLAKVKITKIKILIK